MFSHVLRLSGLYMNSHQRVRDIVALLAADEVEASALIELLNMTSDPKGDQVRYGFARKAIACAYPQTPEGQSRIEEHLEFLNSNNKPSAG